MTRTGASWDVLAAAATLLPVASLAGRRWAVSASLAASGLWILMLIAGAAPEIGRFTPDQVGLAAAAGTVLMAAALAEEALRKESDGQLRTSLALGAGPAAAAICFGIGLVDQPDLSSGTATTLVLAAAAIAAVATLGPPPLRLLLPVALLAGLRGSVELVDPTAVLGLVLAAAAAVVVFPARFAGDGRFARVLVRLQPAGEDEDGDARAAPVALALLSLAVAAGPVPAARLAGALLAAAAVLAVAHALAERPVPTPYVPVHPWLATELGLPPVEDEPGAGPDDARSGSRARAAVLVAATPGASLVVSGLADVPSPGAPSVAVHVVFAALALAVAIGLVVGARLPVPPRSSTDASPSLSPVGAAVGALVAWLVLVPGSWRWAVADPDVLDAWERAAAVAAAAGGLVIAAIVVATVQRDRSVAPLDH